MKAIKLGVFLTAVSLIVAAGTSQIVAAGAANVNDVCRADLYDADGQVVGHVQVSWHTAKDTMLSVKITLNNAEPMTEYYGRIDLGVDGQCCIGGVVVAVDTNPGGAGTSTSVCGFRECPEVMPNCFHLTLVSQATGEEIAPACEPLAR